MTELTWLHQKPTVTGQFKQQAEDFIVQEDLGFAPDGDGEHVLVYVRKTGLNTQFVAEQLAKFAKISIRTVSYAGLKDRNAVTEQWFCLQLPGKETPDFSLFILDGCEVLKTFRHRRKLRIGTLKGNFFALMLREISDSQQLESRLKLIAEQGVPNYFGEQRFGRNGNNLIQAQRWSEGEITVKDRNKKSFYLSAARSAMFNLAVSERIRQELHYTVLAGDAMQLSGRGSWFVAQQNELDLLQQRLQNGEIQITAPLAGTNDLGTKDQALEFELHCLHEQSIFMNLMRRERVESARRALLVKPQNMQWRWLDKNALELTFWLPAGGFATSVLRELMLTNNEFIDVAE